MNDFSFIQYTGSAFISLFVGFLTGIFGVGGGFLMTPALMILLCIPGNIAAGTDLVIIFFNSSVAMLKRKGSGTIDIKLALWLAAGGIFGSQIGLKLLAILKKAPEIQLLGKTQDPVQLTLMVLFLILLTWLAWFMYLDLKKNKGKGHHMRKGLFSKIKIAPYAIFTSLDHPKMPLIPIVTFGLLVGILTALMGVGGGVVMLPALIYLIGQKTQKAAGTSLLFVWVVSISAGSGHIAQGNVKPYLLVGMFAGGLIGTYIGTHVGLKLKGEKIRAYFVYIIMLAVVMVACKLYAMLLL